MSEPVNFEALGLPPDVLEKGGIEILRASVVDGARPHPRGRMQQQAVADARAARLGPSDGAASPGRRRVVR